MDLVCPSHTGRTKNFSSEAKCHCNLAFAYTQLKNYPSASESFKKALSNAKSANNHYLQFQAAEGLGAVHYQLEEYSEAVEYFNQALVVLDNIQQDTGIARERVMEKLSDALEALQKERQDQARRFRSRSRSETQSPRSPGPDSISAQASDRVSDREERIPTADSSPRGSTDSLDGPGKSPPKPLARRLSPELSSVAARTQTHLEKNLPLPEKKKGIFLPPIDPGRSLQLTARHHTALDPITTGSSTSRSHKHVTVSKRKGRKHVLPKIAESPSAVMKPHDSYDRQLHAYMDTYRDREGERRGSRDGSLSSSSESSLSSGGSHDSGDQLGASIFSRHAAKTKHKRRSTTRPPHELSPPPLSASQTASPAHSPLVVQEGSLAIGPNARDMFTTQSHPVQNRQKRRKGKTPVQTEIVSKRVTRVTPEAQEDSGFRSHLLADTPRHSPISSVYHSHHSRMCAIL